MWLCHLCLGSVWQELFPLVDLWTVAGGECHQPIPAVLICAGAPLLPLYQIAPWNPVELCQTICLGFCFEYPSAKLIQKDKKNTKHLWSIMILGPLALPIPVSMYWNSIIIILYEVLFGKLSYLGVKIDNIILISIFLHHKHLQIIRNNIDILILRTISSIINIINATILLQVGVDINIVILCMISLKSTSYSCSTDLLCFIAIINYLYEDGNLVLSCQNLS